MIYVTLKSGCMTCLRCEEHLFGQWDWIISITFLNTQNELRTSYNWIKWSSTFAFKSTKQITWFKQLHIGLSTWPNPRKLATHAILNTKKKGYVNKFMKDEHRWSIPHLGCLRSLVAFLYCNLHSSPHLRMFLK